MKINISRRDLIWSYVGAFMSLTSNILLLPFLMLFLDSDMLGLWYIFASIGAIASLFDFGFSLTFARNITYCWSGASKLEKEDVSFTQEQEPDFALMNNVLKTCRYIYLLISLIALLLLASAGTAYIAFLTKDINVIECLIAWAIYIIAVFLNLYYGYFTSFLRGVGAIETVNKITVISRLAQIVLTVVLLLLGCGLIGTCAGYLVYGTMFRIFGKYKFYSYQGIGKELSKVENKTDFNKIKELFIVIWHNAWRDGLISMCNYFSNQASTLICSMYLSLAETGIYSLCVQIVSAISTISATAYTTYQPVIQADYVAGRKENVKRTMSTIVISYIVLFIALMGGLIFAGIPALKLIKPDAIVGVSVLIGLGFYQFILVFRNCYTSYFSCTNRLPYVKAFVISSIAGVVLSFLFIGPMNRGIWGLITAQIMSQIVYNAWYWMYKAHKEMSITFAEMVKISIYEIEKKLKKNKYFLSEK